MRALRWIITLPLLLVLLVFALTNRAEVNLSFWPFDFALKLPLSFMLALTLAIGLLLGALNVWLNDLKYKFEAQKLRREVVALKDKLTAMQNQSTPRPTSSPMEPTPLKRRIGWPNWGP